MLLVIETRHLHLLPKIIDGGQHEKLKTQQTMIDNKNKQGEIMKGKKGSGK